MREYNKTVFIKTLDDIRARLISEDDYDAIRATGLLRHLFLDQTNLVNLVKSEYGMKVKFYISSGEGMPENLRKGLVLEFVSLEPSPNPQNNKDAGIKEFLSTPILYITGDKYTVRDIIHITATFLGGIHSKPGINQDSNKNQEKEEKIFLLEEFKKNLAKRLNIKQENINITAIKDIARLSLRGLERLEKRVRRDLKESK